MEVPRFNCVYTVVVGSLSKYSVSATCTGPRAREGDGKGTKLQKAGAHKSDAKSVNVLFPTTYVAPGPKVMRI